jgi:hypothetical protein
MNKAGATHPERTTYIVKSESVLYLWNVLVSCIHTEAV